MDPSSRVSDPGTRWVVDDVPSLATKIRLRAVQMIAPQGFGYPGQALSAAEQVPSVFGHARPGLDRLACFPGHSIVAPFAAAVTACPTAPTATSSSPLPASPPQHRLS